MTPRRCVAAVAPLIGAVWGCGASTEQSAKVTAMSPASAFNDVAFPASIAGDSTWQSPEAIAMMVPAGIPAGAYDVVVTDPRGNHAQLDGGFLSLGPDTQ